MVIIFSMVKWLLKNCRTNIRKKLKLVFRTYGMGHLVLAKLQLFCKQFLYSGRFANCLLQIKNKKGCYGD